MGDDERDKKGSPLTSTFFTTLKEFQCVDFTNFSNNYHINYGNYRLRV